MLAIFRLKPSTCSVIGELQAAKLRTIMVTGDNINTAVSVAKESGIIDYGVVVIATAFLANGDEESEVDNGNVMTSSDGKYRLSYHQTDAVTPALKQDERRSDAVDIMDK